MVERLPINHAVASAFEEEMELVVVDRSRRRVRGRTSARELRDRPEALEARLSGVVENVQLQQIVAVADVNVCSRSIRRGVPRAKIRAALIRVLTSVPVVPSVEVRIG